jgi:4'-phosphopantetheinyl transferase
MGVFDRDRSWDALREGACHLWHFRPASISDPPLLERALAFLSTDELARRARYLVPEPARTFLAARIMVRSILSLYAPIPPSAWHFEANRWGRPYIANPEAPPGLLFNLSHKPGLVTCLVGCGRDLGVDVEDASANRPYLREIAERFFSAAEVADLVELPEAQHLRRFFELWTLKESYIKARGIGLSLGLSRFSFSVEEIPSPSCATVTFDPDFDDDAESWDFRLFRPDERHLIATSVRRCSTPLLIEIADADELVFHCLTAPDGVNTPGLF